MILMIHKSTKQYLLKKAKSENITLPENYEYILDQFQNLAAQYEVKIVFKKLHNTTESKLNANAGYTNHSDIVITPEWAYHLITNNTSIVKNAFKITIGHELTHHEVGKFVIFKNGFFASTFCSWVNEVYCDFGGTQKMADSSREKLVNAIIYKKSNTPNEITDHIHPSWNKRRYYAEHYDFNEKLIRKIAEDIHYHNQKVIQKVCNYYPEIILK